MRMPGSELSDAGFERDPVKLNFPPLLMVTLALVFAAVAKLRNDCPPPLARSRVMAQFDPAPSIVTLAVTRPVWPLLAPTTLEPVVARDPPPMMFSVANVGALAVPKPVSRVPVPTAKDPKPLSTPPLIVNRPVEPAALAMLL